MTFVLNFRNLSSVYLCCSPIISRSTEVSCTRCFPLQVCANAGPRFETKMRNFVCIQGNTDVEINIHSAQRLRSLSGLQLAALPLRIDTFQGEEESTSESEHSEPWLGAVLFKRSAIRTHYEYQTTLEKLGLTLLSSELSRAATTSMKLGGSESDSEQCTVVNVSIDALREGEGKDLRLEGLLRTALTLCCNRCLSPCVEKVFAEFSLVLTEKPVVQPTQQKIGVVLGETGGQGSDEEGVRLDIDLDDKLYFPQEMKEMDISKYIRDTVHLEIPYKSYCSNQCQGLCISCGVNLNTSSCKCVADDIKPSWGPLEGLKRQLEEEHNLDSGLE